MKQWRKLKAIEYKYVNFIMNCDYKKYSLSESVNRMDSSIQNIDKLICIRDSIKDSEEQDVSVFQSAYILATVMSIVVHSDTEWDDPEGEKELALGYKIILQETIALLRDCCICRAYYIDGVHIIGVFDTPKKENIKTVVDLSARISSMIEIWKFKRDRNKLCDFRSSIGIHYGRLLKFAEEDKINSGNKKSVFLGLAMQQADMISYQPIPEKQSSSIRISSIVYQNLNTAYQKMFHWEIKYDCYQSTLYNVEMKKWLQEKEDGK